MAPKSGVIHSSFGHKIVLMYLTNHKGASIHDDHKILVFFDPLPRSLLENYLLFVRKFGVFLVPPPSVRTSYMEAPYLQAP